MKTEKHSNYLLVRSDESSFETFFKNFKETYKTLEDNHLILVFSKEINMSIKDLLLLLDISSAHKMKKLSFICVASQVEIDELPEEFSVVPTLVEAEDILEMDEIERDLGF